MLSRGILFLLPLSFGGVGVSGRGSSLGLVRTAAGRMLGDACSLLRCGMEWRDEWNSGVVVLWLLCSALCLYELELELELETSGNLKSRKGVG